MEREGGIGGEEWMERRRGGKEGRKGGGVLGSRGRRRVRVEGREGGGVVSRGGRDKER